MKTKKTLVLAIVFLGLFISLNAQSKEELYQEAFSHIENEEYSKAISLLNKVIKIDKDNAELYFDRGYCKLELDNNEDAIKDFTKAIELDEWNAYYYFRGISYFRIGQQEKACDDWSQAYSLGHKDSLESIIRFCQ